MVVRVLIGIGASLALVAAVILSPGDELAAQTSLLDTPRAGDQKQGMQELGVVVRRLQAWSKADWSRPQSTPALGEARLPCPDGPAPLLAYLKQHLRGLELPARGAPPHFEQRRDDAVLAVRMLALAVGSDSPRRGKRALVRLQQACVHCHDACRP